MARRTFLAGLGVCLAPALALAIADGPGRDHATHQTGSRIRGRYLEVRSCDVYTGPCFANAEMGIAGREGMLVWTIDKGSWNGADLAGLSVVAVIEADATLGDVRQHPVSGRAVLITDARATPDQRDALVAFARTMAGSLLDQINDVRPAPVSVSIAGCGNMGCASVSSPGLIEITTRCLGNGDHLCGNEDTYYPPLTPLDHATAAFSEMAAFRGEGLNVRWEGRDQRNVFIGNFSL